MKIILLYLNVVIASGVLFVNLYHSLVDARIWASELPRSIRVAREYTLKFSPANFFKIFGPAQMLLTIANVLLFWPAPVTRWCMLTAFLLCIATEVFTVKFFFPRNDILFRTGDLADIGLLKKTLTEWQLMNWLRSGMLLACLSLIIAATYFYRSI